MQLDVYMQVDIYVFSSFAAIHAHATLIPLPRSFPPLGFQVLMTYELQQLIKRNCINFEP
jgi:3-phosphoglycerate kinase